MKKYTDEQLSRILSASANCELGRVTFDYTFGHPWTNSNPKRKTLCIEQAANAAYSSPWCESRYLPYDKMIRAKKGHAKIIKNPDNMLKWLEKHEMA